MARVRFLLLPALLLLVSPASRAQYAAADFRLAACGISDPLFRSGMESGEQPGVRASAGLGGAGPGPVTLMVDVPDTARQHAFHAYLPYGHDPQQPLPLVIALHGSAGSADAAPLAALEIRDFWQPLVQREAVALLVPIGSGPGGGWAPALDTPALACGLAAMERRYNIDLDRRFLWGFSAGGHFGHAIALGNAQALAAYAVNAGALHGLACAPPGNPGSCASTLPMVARRIPVSLRTGNLDPLQALVQGDATRLQAAGWGAGELQYAEFAGGHWADVPDIEAAWGWFAAHPRSP